MSHKTIKISLLILLLLVGLNTISFIFGETVPDNIYLITDSTNTVNSFTYYLFSFLSFIAYYTGVWLVLPLLLLSMSYILVINKRDKSIDSIIPLILLTFSFCFSIILLPEFVGVGLLKLTKEVTTFSELTLYTVLFAFISFFIILRGSVKYVTSMLHDFGLGMIRMIAKQTKRFVAYLKSLKEGEKPLVDFSKITGKLTFALRKSGASNNIPIQNNPHEDSYRQYSEVQKMQPEVSVEKDRIQNLETKEIKEEERNSILPKLEIKKPKVRKVSVQDQPSFESKSLIECISSEDQKIKIDSPDEEYFKGIIQAIESKLAEFNIDSTVVNILKGPVVDTFELELGAGIKVSKVKNLSDDLGLALGSYIRIVVQMKGKSTIGVEVPRNPREIIYLDDVLKTDSYINTKHRLPIAMGKNAFGETHVVDLAGMPHMLVAGATGAGKSVFINTLLVSLIVKKSPKDLKLILIDPKQLELALYQRLPHLLMPVITEPKMAAVSLLWAVQEMERRYSILKEMGMRDIEGFNRKVKNAGPETLGRISGFYEDFGDEDGYELPYLVVIIDEFADLILTKVGKEIETNVSRLAAKARAAGIHLVVATQRPSTDVITGVIKSNFPTRVSFRVTTNTDSRVVLDSPGAERLLGKGDMLYKHGIDLNRYHSAYVDEEEIEVLVDELAKYKTEYLSAAMDFLESGGEELEDSMNGPVSVSMGSGAGKDALYDEAVKTVVEQGSASASMLQRRLKVGYNRAANLIEEMERSGVVGPQQGSKPRKVLLIPGE